MGPMPSIDLDDLPPKVAKTLENLAAGEELLLVRAGALVARLTVGEAPGDAPAAPPSGVEMQEILDHFQSIIDDEF
jgi:hypothetical protein